MKKFLGVVVLGLLWQNLVLANDLAILVFNKWLYDNGHQKYVIKDNDGYKNNLNLKLSKKKMDTT